MRCRAVSKDLSLRVLRESHRNAMFFFYKNEPRNWMPPIDNFFFFLQKSWKISRPHYRFLLFNNRTIHQKSRKVINGRYSVPSSPPLLFSFECKQVQRSKRREVIKKNQAIDPNDFIAKSNKIKVREMERWTWNAFFSSYSTNNLKR